MKNIKQRILLVFILSGCSCMHAMEISRQLIREKIKALLIKKPEKKIKIPRLFIEDEYILTQQKRGHSQRWFPAVYYKIMPKLLLGISVPIFIKRELDCVSSQGIGDMFLESTQYWYRKKTGDWTRRFLTTFDVKLPTGSTSETPALGTGAADLKITVEGSVFSENFFTYAIWGGIARGELFGVRVGNELFYRFFFGPKFNRGSNGWSTIYLLELGGIFGGKTKINRIPQAGTGETNVLLGPSVYAFKDNRSLSIEALGSVFKRGNNPTTFILVVNYTVTF